MFAVIDNRKTFSLIIFFSFITLSKMITNYLAFNYSILYIYSMKLPPLNFIGYTLPVFKHSKQGHSKQGYSQGRSLQKRTSQKDTSISSTNLNNRVTNIDRNKSFSSYATPHPFGCQCESCEAFLYFQLDMSRS